MTKDKFITRAYSLEQADADVIEGMKNKHSISASGALRLIIREWAQLKKDRANLLSNKLDRENPYWLTEAGIDQTR